MPRLLLLAGLTLLGLEAASQPIALGTFGPDSIPVQKLGEVVVTGIDRQRVSCRGCGGGGCHMGCAASREVRLFVFPAFTTILPTLPRVAGVQMTPYSGAPGAWATVRIRGVSNLTGRSQPLYVVDGVPAYNTDVSPEQAGAAPAGLFSGPGTPQTPTANPLLDLPVEDVEMVEVLKGAAATARYGAQGANGVILISTKRGADGQAAPQPLRVRYAAWAGVQQVRQRYELLGARQYAELRNAAASSRAGGRALYSPAEIDALTDADWQDRVFRTAGIQSHHLSVDGLAKSTRYYAAADYLSQAGVVQGSRLSRYHLRANLEQALTAKLSLQLRTSASQTDQRYAGSALDAGPLLQNALLADPIAPDPAVPASTAYPNGATVALDNLGYEREQRTTAPRTRRLLVQLGATYQFSSALGLSVTASREQADTRELGGAAERNSGGFYRPAYTSTTTATMRNWVGQARLSYQRRLGELHAVAASLGGQAQYWQQTQENVTLSPAYQSGFYNEQDSPIRYLPSAQVSYTYDGRYEVQASLGAGTVLRNSSGGYNGRPAGGYQLYPGGQLSWHAHKEAFLAAAGWLSELTLWAGAGQAGTYFTPDRSTHYDAGLRLGLLGGRLTLDAGAYQRRIRYAETAGVMSSSTGGVQGITPASPETTLANRGLELTLGASWGRGSFGGLSQLALASTRSEVESLDPKFSYPGLEAGQPLSRFRVYEQDGIHPAGSPQAGQVRIRDRNGNDLAQSDDQYYETGGLPRYSLGLVQQLRLRRFQLDAQLDGLFGYQILNNTLQTLDTPTGFTNSSVRALDYWTPAHQDTSVPQPGGNSARPLTNLDLSSGNHVRLSQLSFSYEVLSKGPRKASVWVGGQNLFVSSSYRGFDPNVSGGGAAPVRAGRDDGAYPVARVWQLGVRASF